MRKFSTAAVDKVAGHLDIEVTDDELETVSETIQNLLADAQDICSIPLPCDDLRGTRTWREPTDDPHNVLSCACSVKFDNTDGFLSGLEAGV